MSKDESQRAIEEAEKAAKALKHELRRAKTLIEETRLRLQGSLAPERQSFGPLPSDRAGDE